MKTRRLAIGGISLFAAISLGIAGCGSGSGSSTTGGNDKGSTTITQLTPQERLAEAAQHINKETAKIKLESSALTADGLMDPANKKMSMTVKMSVVGQSMDMQMIVLDKDVYVKMAGLPGMGDKWMHIDGSAVKSGSTLDELFPDGDPGGVRRMLDGMVDVQPDGERGFKGTIDLTKSPTANETIKAMGDKAKVPFTARLDEQGRLVELTIDMTPVEPEAGKMTVSYSDFGVPVTIEKPAASEIIEAPAELAKSFTGGN